MTSPRSTILANAPVVPTHTNGQERSGYKDVPDPRNAASRWWLPVTGGVGASLLLLLLVLVLVALRRRRDRQYDPARAQARLDQEGPTSYTNPAAVFLDFTPTAADQLATEEAYYRRTMAKQGGAPRGPETSISLGGRGGRPEAWTGGSAPTSPVSPSSFRLTFQPQARDWELATDPVTGRAYYHNVVTHETSWALPEPAMESPA